ncbi:MAG: Uma2 family endonuclease [Isosphaeraceae bacterium]
MSSLASMPTHPAAPIRIPWPLYRMSIEQYESLIVSDFFDARDDVHLVDGYVVNRMAESPLHGTVCEAIRMAMGAIFLALAGWHLRSEKGVRIPSRTSIPRPDLAVVRGNWRDYLTHYPDAADVAMVAEVSVSSLDKDRAMADIYAAGGIPVYWIVDVDHGQVEVYSNPGPSGYQSHEVLAPGHVLRVVIDGVAVGEIAVSDILP